MDITVAKKDLLNLVKRCRGVTTSRGTMPALSMVFLAATRNAVRVAATDLYLSAMGVASAETRQPGSVAVPARDLYERLQHLPDGPVHITVADGATVALKAVASARRYTLHGMPGTDFPALDEPEDRAPSIELPVAVLARLIASVEAAVSADETRAALNSALLELDGETVRMVATDGHRLAVVETRVEGASATMTMLISARALGELGRLASEAAGDDATVVISRGSGTVFFALGGVRLGVKPVEATFPPYAQVVPKKVRGTVRVWRSTLVDAARAVSVAASDRTGGVKLRFGDGVVRLTSESPEAGDGFDEVSIDYDGPTTTVGLNARYLVDALAPLDAGEVTLGIGSDIDPVVITPCDGNGYEYTAVVMPMRI